MFSILKNVILLGLTVFCVLAIILVWQFVGVHLASPSKDSKMALWMEHEWSTSNAKDFAELHEQIKDFPVEYLYFHVGPLEPDGTLPEDLDIKAESLNALTTKNLAWIGQIRNKIDLEDPQVRAEIIQSAEWLMDQGFDGIHIDIEPIRPDDHAFIVLMQELRAALPNAFLSVAMDEWQPFFFHKIAKSYWTRSQTRKVSKFSDQMVVMIYDTDLDNAKIYTWWVELQAVNLSKILTSGTELFIGIPSYEKGPSINPEVENVKTGLLGYKKALQNLRTNQKILKGLAIYPHWELSQEEWDTLKDL